MNHCGHGMKDGLCRWRSIVPPRTPKRVIVLFEANSPFSQQYSLLGCGEWGRQGLWYKLAFQSLRRTTNSQQLPSKRLLFALLMHFGGHLGRPDALTTES